jgi:hypothetical protein
MASRTYYEDNFQQPNPFRPDVAVDIDDVGASKIDPLDGQVSQMYDWLAWVAGTFDRVPKDGQPAKHGSLDRAGMDLPGHPGCAPFGTWGWRCSERIRFANAFDDCAHAAALRPHPRSSPAGAHPFLDGVRFGGL